MSYRYLGNKARLAEWIVGLVAERLPPGSVVADLMCGTATMSEAFARAGYTVIAGDELKFPVLHAQARLFDALPEFVSFGTTYEEAVSALNRLPSCSGLFSREYSAGGRPANGARPRAYFTSENAGRIDAARATIKLWRRQGMHSLAADLLLHNLMLASNRVANIAGTYGYYRSTFSAASLAKMTILPTMKSIDGTTAHRVIQGDVVETIATIYPDALYLDPPYTKRQYAGNYHILETIAQEDEPIPVGEGGLRDWSDQASDFCYRRRAAGAFRSVLDNCTAKWVFISYSEDAQLTDYEMAALLCIYGTVHRYDQPLERFRSNARVSRKGDVREHLYVLEMKYAEPVKPRRGVDERSDPQ
ncbi:MAG TPA: DNA adenine methylase [Allosphingosinicella sp.]|jgi:adenine-specific DNA-methyltransferase